MLDKYNFFKIENCFKNLDEIPSLLIQGKRIKSSCDLTVSIPTFKRADTLCQTIESVLSQKGNHIVQIIVVDNCPERNDDTEVLMRRYLDRDNILYFKNSQNLGMAGNWNRCVQLAETTWVTLLHDDDLIVENYLQRVSLCLNDEYDAVFVKMKMFEDGGKLPIIPESKHLSLERITLLYQYLFPVLPPSANVLKTSTIKKLGGFSSEIFAPDVFFSKLAYYGKVYLTNQTLALYRKGVNESQKISAQNEMCIMNHAFRIQLYKIINIPAFVIKRALLYSDILFEKGFQNVWNISFKYSEMPNYSKSEYLISKIVYHLMVCYIKIKIALQREIIKIY